MQGDTMGRGAQGNPRCLRGSSGKTLVDVLDGDDHQRKAEDAQDALTKAAPHVWLEEAEEAENAAADATRSGSGDGGV